MLDAHDPGYSYTKLYYLYDPETLVDYLMYHDLASYFSVVVSDYTDELVEAVVRHAAPTVLSLIIDSGYLPPASSLHQMVPDPDKTPQPSWRIASTVDLLVDVGVPVSERVATIAVKLNDVPLLSKIHEHGVNLTQKMANIAAERGYVNVVEYIDARSRVLPNEPVTLAAAHGHPNVLRHYDWWNSHTSIAPELAARYNHPSAVRLLLPRHTITNRVVYWLARHGHERFVRELYQHGWWSIDSESLPAVARAGHLPLFQYVLTLVVNYYEHPPTTVPLGTRLPIDLPTSDSRVSSLDADYQSNRATFDLLKRRHQFTSEWNVLNLVRLLRASMQVAALEGRLSIVKYLHTEFLLPYTVDVLNNAAASGSFVLTLLIYQELAPMSQSVKLFNARALSYAAAHSLDLVKFVRERLVEPIDHAAIERAATVGSYETVKYLVEQGAPVYNNQLNELLQLWSDQGRRQRELSPDTFIRPDTTRPDGLTVAPATQLTIVKLLLQHYRFPDRERERAAASALSVGHLELFKYLVQHAPLQYTPRTFVNAALQRDDPAAIALLQELNVPFPPHIVNLAAQGDRYWTVRYLLNHGYQPVTDRTSPHIIGVREQFGVAELLIRYGYGDALRFDRTNVTHQAFLEYLERRHSMDE